MAGVKFASGEPRDDINVVEGVSGDGARTLERLRSLGFGDFARDDINVVDGVRRGGAGRVMPMIVNRKTPRLRGEAGTS